MQKDVLFENVEKIVQHKISYNEITADVDESTVRPFNS